MADFKVTCLGKPGTTYNYVIDGTDCIFTSGTVKIVNETIANMLQKQKLANGKSLFRVEENKIEESKIEEDKFVTSLVSDIVEEEPSVVKVPVNNKKTFPSFKKESNKKQDKLI